MIFRALKSQVTHLTFLVFNYRPRGSKRKLQRDADTLLRPSRSGVLGELTCSRRRPRTPAAFLPERPAAETTSHNPPGPRSWSVCLAGDTRETHEEGKQQVAEVQLDLLTFPDAHQKES